MPSEQIRESEMVFEKNNNQHLMSKNLLIFCVTDKLLPFSLNFPYKFAGVGKNTFSHDYLLSNTLDNIYYK